LEGSLVFEDLAGKVAVVTGAGSGIGAALARACSTEGMRVVAADVNRDRVDAVVDSLAGPEPACAIAVDVADPESVDRLAAETFGMFGATHLLFNNAGVSPLGLIWEFEPEDWNRLFGVNVMGVVNGLRSFVPRMMASGEAGHIVNTGSGGSFQSQAALGAYAATKHAILAITDALRQELADHDIGVTLLCPGGVNTNIVESMKRPSSSSDDTETWGYINRMMADNDQATNTLIEPDQVAAMALWGIRENLPYVVCAPGQRARAAAHFDTILDAHDRAAQHDTTLP
jgi:NAD(P)-dependent dehydrogenase (short-subunit alcohol dehydrogenase family)